MDGTKGVGRDLQKTDGCIQQDVKDVTHGKNNNVTWKRIRRTNNSVGHFTAKSESTETQTTDELLRRNVMCACFLTTWETRNPMVGMLQ
jgi:hypothetical protein